MKKLVLTMAALTSALTLGGCGATQQDRTVGGAALGAVAGGVLGAAVSGGRPGAAVAGAVVGGIAGAAVGANTPGPEGRRCVAIRYDYNGNQYCARFAPTY